MERAHRTPRQVAIAAGETRYKGRPCKLLHPLPGRGFRLRGWCALAVGKAEDSSLNLCIRLPGLTALSLAAKPLSTAQASLADRLAGLPRREEYFMSDNPQIGHLVGIPGPLTYWVKNYPAPAMTDLSQREVTDILAKAGEKWAAVSNFSFVPYKGSTPADAQIHFQFGPTEPGNWAQAVPEGLRGNKAIITFSDKVRWTSLRHDPNTKMPPLGVLFPFAKTVDIGTRDLLTIAVHELGHALSLAHHNISGSVMQKDIDLMSSTWQFYMWGHGVPLCDAQALAKEWGDYSIEPFVGHPAVSGGYVVVGSRFEITSQDETIPARPYPNYSWGQDWSPKGKIRSALVAQGNCWDWMRNAPGYGRLYLHLAAKDTQTDLWAGQDVLWGGRLNYQNRDSSNPPGWDGYEWGWVVRSQGEIKARVVGHMYDWNSKLRGGAGSEGVTYFYGTTAPTVADSPAAVPVLGGRTKVFQGRTAEKLCHWRDQWGQKDGPVDKGEVEVVIAEGKTKNDPLPLPQYKGDVWQRTYLTIGP